MSAMEVSTTNRVVKFLLACGILSSVLYFTGDLVMSLTYQGYSYLDQTVSELNAIGAPTRGLSIAFGLAGYVLLVCFGVGIWSSAPANRRLRVAGGALAFMGLTALWAVPFASMQVRGTEQEGLHLISGLVGVFVLLTAIGFAAAAIDGPFRLYSIATILVMLAFAGWAGMDAGRVEAGLPTPWLGLRERISFYSWYLWFIVLALVLLRRGSMGRAAASS